MTDIFGALAAEFPRDAVHWRAQTLTGDGDKALALAYLDARDVMDRLDDVCTPAGWRNTVTETAKGRLIATIEIKVGDEWIGKTDGAGDTDVEGDKGGISDALKRAAVLWGIGRYLYRMKAVWAPCTTYEKGGKKYWKAWNGSPWDAVRSASRAPAATVARPATVPANSPPESVKAFIAGMEQAAAKSQAALGEYWLAHHKSVGREHLAYITVRKDELKQKEAA
jgi:hypothetical protein